MGVLVGSMGCFFGSHFMSQPPYTVANSGSSRNRCCRLVDADRPLRTVVGVVGCFDDCDAVSQGGEHDYGQRIVFDSQPILFMVVTKFTHTLAN